MAFSDLPIIDSSSVNSERSERALSAFLNQQSGFICRPDKPDKGCDFDVELIIDDKNAANHRFGIQLKSVEQLPLLADGLTISYSFETSRLGYLLNRVIGEGLIVLYDVANDRLYYEYAVILYNRLMLEKGSDDWQQQESVNIHIPISNLLQETAATAIHAHFQERFETAAFLFASQGSRYGLVVAKPGTDSRYDLNNPEQVRELLLNHGLGLLHEHELDLCFWLLRKLSLTEIEAYPELMMLAAIAYGEAGRRYDSENFIRKLYKCDQVPQPHKQMIRFCHLKNQMMLDQIDMAEFKAGAITIRDEETNVKNILLLDLNIIFYELLSVKFYHGLPPDILARIRSVFSQIADMKIDDRSRKLIEVNNAENLSQYINFIRLTFFNDLAVRRATKAGRSLQLEQKRKELHVLENELNGILERIYIDGESRDDHLLQGNALLVRSRYLMAREFDLYSQWPMLRNLRFHNLAMYIQNIRLALSGHDHFMEIGYVELAHQSLYSGIELILIGRHVYRYKDGIDLDDLLARKRKMEMEHELEVIDFQFPSLIKRMASIRKEEKHYMSDTKEMDDEQLKGMADTISRAFGLPAHCLPNLLSELHNCRLFYRRCHADLELIPYDRNYDQRILYRTEVRFVIHNKRTNLRSVPSSDVAALLNSWGI